MVRKVSKKVRKKYLKMLDNYKVEHINHSSEAIELSSEMIEKLSKLPIPCITYKKSEQMMQEQVYIEYSRGHSKVMVLEKLKETNKKYNTMLSKKQNAKRYRLHIYLRKKGFEVDARRREVSVDETTDMNLRQINILKNEFQYNIQTLIK